jgi:excisionase family DNA binding protein
MLQRNRTEQPLHGTITREAWGISDNAAEAMSVAEAATRAGVSRTFLYERISSGELPTVKLGKRRLVRVEALRRWLASLETRAA